MSEAESFDKLIGNWSVFQLKGGHRFSTDDVVTAWRAHLALPEAVTMLDIGSGIGSVGLSALHRVSRGGERKEVSLVCVEAQEVSVGLLQRSIQANNLQSRVRVVQGDLRDGSVLPPDAKFDLITGSPPYVPIGNGLMSPHPQRAACRMELRGSVFDYCEAAARWLAPEGRFCFVMLAGDKRTEEAPLAAGLEVLERWDYVFRAGRTPHIATLVCALPGATPRPRISGEMVVRTKDGEWTEEYLAFRSETFA